MKKLFLDINFLLRISVLMLCMIFAFSFIAKPFTVSASAAATIAIGFGGVVKFVLPKVAIACIILLPFVAMGETMLLDTVYEFFEEYPEVEQWADSNSHLVASGNVITVPNYVQEALRDYLPLISPDTYLGTVTIPNDLTYLDNYTRHDIFVKDAVAQLEETNTKLNGIQTILDSVYSLQLQLNTTLTEKLSDISKDIDRLFSNFADRLGDIRTELYTINSNISDRLSSIRTMMTTINDNITDRLSSIRSVLSTINTNIANRLSDIQDRVKGIATTLTNTSSEIIDKIVALPNEIALGLESSFSQLETTIREAFASGTVTTPPNNYEGPVYDQTVGGKNNLPLVMDPALDILAKYTNAFLAVSSLLSMFIGLPVVGELVQFGFALGIFALIVNLSNTLLKDDEKATKATGKKTKLGNVKGG